MQLSSELLEVEDGREEPSHGTEEDLELPTGRRALHIGEEVHSRRVVAKADGGDNTTVSAGFGHV